MSDDTFGFLLGLFLGVVVSFFVTLAFTNTRYTNAAIEANVAHYEVDPLTGKTKFVYDCPNCNKE